MRPFLRNASVVLLSLALAPQTLVVAQASSVLGAHALRVDVSPLVKTDFIYGGDAYCWFDGGWRGPGWYRCQYGPWVAGYWWGGGVGWNGWHGGHDHRMEDRRMEARPQNPASNQPQRAQGFLQQHLAQQPHVQPHPQHEGHGERH